MSQVTLITSGTPGGFVLNPGVSNVLHPPHEDLPNVRTRPYKNNVRVHTYLSVGERTTHKDCRLSARLVRYKTSARTSYAPLSAVDGADCRGYESVRLVVGPRDTESVKTTVTNCVFS